LGAGGSDAAVRTTTVRVGFRLVGADGVVLDAVPDAVVADRWRGTDDRPAPSAEATIDELAGSAGIAYARRLASVRVDVTRPYYVRGARGLREAHSAVVAGDWQRAVRLWSEVSGAAHPVAQARARYDLAIAYEVDGQVKRALDEVELALALDDDPRIARYRRQLADALAASRVLRHPAEGELR
ncbi:MAG: DUF6340 family protein, partial [Myxococcota bacterium]